MPKACGRDKSTPRWRGRQAGSAGIYVRPGPSPVADGPGVPVPKTGVPRHKRPAGRWQCLGDFTCRSSRCEPQSVTWFSQITPADTRHSPCRPRTEFSGRTRGRAARSGRNLASKEPISASELTPLRLASGRNQPKPCFCPRAAPNGWRTQFRWSTSPRRHPGRHGQHQVAHPAAAHVLLFGHRRAGAEGQHAACGVGKVTFRLSPSSLRPTMVPAPAPPPSRMFRPRPPSAASGNAETESAT